MARPQAALKVYETTKTATTGLLKFIVPITAGTIKTFYVKADTGPSGGAANFDLNKNGASVLGSPLSIASGQNSAQVALNVAVVLGDEITVDLDSTPNAIGADLFLLVAIEESGALASDAELRDRSTHTGTQPASSVTPPGGDNQIPVNDGGAWATDPTLTFDPATNEFRGGDRMSVGAAVDPNITLNSERAGALGATTSEFYRALRAKLNSTGNAALTGLEGEAEISGAANPIGLTGVSGKATHNCGAAVGNVWGMNNTAQVIGGGSATNLIAEISQAVLSVGSAQNARGVQADVITSGSGIISALAEALRARLLHLAATTLAEVRGLAVTGWSKGGSSVITKAVGLFIDANTVDLATGEKFAIQSLASAPSRLAGQFELRKQAAPASPPADHLAFYPKEIDGVLRAFYRRPDGTEVEFGLATASPFQTRNSYNFTTPALVNDAYHDFELALGKTFLPVRITTSAPAWVQLYATDAARDADLNRPVNQDPAGEHGLICEVLTTPSNLEIRLSPQVPGSNGDATPSTNIYCRARNKSGVTQAITVTVESLRME